jgi:hypothetical protein
MALSNGYDDTSRRSLAVKVAVISAAVLGAVYFAFLRGDPERAQNDDPESATPYACEGCGHVFDLTPAGFEQLAEEGVISGDQERGGVMRVQCPQCRQVAACMATRCPKHPQVAIPLRPGSDKTRCDRCGWSPFEGR